MAEIYNNQYLKFMIDLIDSGVWARLSPAAKSLYPVLLKFSDQNFKSVWPSTSLLLNLTGFKSKKSIIQAKRELAREGLIQFKPGSGRMNSLYYFTFNYTGSRITPQGWKNIPLSGSLKEPFGGDAFYPQGDLGKNPNQINITIHNNHSLNSNDRKEMKREINSTTRDSTQELIEFWNSFLDWTSLNLTKSSSLFFKQMEIAFDGNTIFIKTLLSEFQKQIINRFLELQRNPNIIILFTDEKILNE